MPQGVNGQPTKTIAGSHHQLLISLLWEAFNIFFCFLLTILGFLLPFAVFVSCKETAQYHKKLQSQRIAIWIGFISALFIYSASVLTSFCRYRYKNILLDMHIKVDIDICAFYIKQLFNILSYT